MKVSVIIAVKAWNDFLKESLRACLKLSHGDFEIIVLPDRGFHFSDERVRIIPTGPSLPAQKRDLGAAQANGEILAFIDDDAYPSESWLDVAVPNFSDPDIAAVCGPGVTPPAEGERRQASGLVYESFAASGHYRYRYMPDTKRFVDDFPSCNLLVRKSVFDELGGFKTSFWPGEDTILCLEITTRLKKKILYDPGALVFHHRRPLFLAHLKQVANYALHRGYFVKRFPETSLKWPYFVPMAFVCWLLFGFIFPAMGFLWGLFYFFSLLAYGIFIFMGAHRKNNPKLTALVMLGIFLTHVFYGIFFVAGLLSSKLKEEEAAS